MEQSVAGHDDEEEGKAAASSAAISQADHQLAPSDEKEPEHVTQAFFKVCASFIFVLGSLLFSISITVLSSLF